MRTWTIGAALTIAFGALAAGCGDAPAAAAAAPRAKTSRRAPPPLLVGSVTGTVDPLAAAAGTPQFFIETPVVKDGLATNPPFTVEVKSAPGTSGTLFRAANGGGACGTNRDSYEGPVVITSFFQEQLYDVYLEFFPITGTGPNRICGGMAATPDIDLDGQLSTTFGLIDYTNGGDVHTPGNQTQIGSYTQGPRAAVSNAIAANATSVQKNWAFDVTGLAQFTYTAHVFASLRPRAATLESPFVDGGSVPGSVYVWSGDTPTGGPGTAIADRVNLWTYSDSGLATQIESTTVGMNTATGVGSVAGAPAANQPAGTLRYVRLQNTWPITGGTGVGVTVPDSASIAYGYVGGSNGGYIVTTPATRSPSLGRISPAPGQPAPVFVADSRADGIEAQIYSAGTAACSAANHGALVTLVQYVWNTGNAASLQPLPTSVPLSDPGNPNWSWIPTPSFSLTKGNVYCYRVRNVFTGMNTLMWYPGAYSTLWGSFTAP